MNLTETGINGVYLIEPAVFGDYGTFVLSVEDKYLIWIFDTHEKDGHGGFGCLHPDQIEWYRKTRDEYEKKLQDLRIKYNNLDNENRRLKSIQGAIMKKLDTMDSLFSK